MRVHKFVRIAFVLALAILPRMMFAQAPVSDDTFATANHGNEHAFHESAENNGRDGNFGSLPYLAVQGPDANAYVRFDLSRLPDGVTGDQVQKATVRLWVAGVTQAGSFDVKRVMSSWNEQTLTGQKLPLLGIADLSGVKVSLSSKEHYLVLDITNLVKDWLNQVQPNYGIALLPVGNVSVAFDSKENAVNSHDPELNVVLADAGPVGPQGLQGVAGPVGPMGPTGATGAQGPAGPTGATGAVGAAGPAGPTGATGATGAQGPAGPMGATGAVGAVGPVGPIGPAGATGAQGPAGPIGATGAVGAVGPVGPIGPTGAMGAQGPAGPIGATGAVGAVGPVGPIGPTGAMGAQGPAGPIGATGAVGAVGPIGPIGATGATGAQGPAGPIGATGAVGAVGPIGPMGPAGAVGAIGPQGSTGPQGPAGPQGVPGAAGAVGGIGPQGSTGSQGPAGPQGAAGAVGPMGPMGLQGPPGPVNYPGTGSLSASHTFAPASAVNLSAEGSADWFTPDGNTNPVAFRSKMLGGQIAKSFDFVTAGQLTFTGASSFALTSSAGDDSTGMALTSFNQDQGVYTPGAATGFGFRLRAPASSSATRTLRIYCSAYSAMATLTVRLSDGSAAAATDVVDLGPAAYNYFVWTITYQAARDGQEIEVSGIVTKNYGSSPNLKFVAATLQ